MVFVVATLLMLLFAIQVIFSMLYLGTKQPKYIFLVYVKSICVPVHLVCVLKSIFSNAVSNLFLSVKKVFFSMWGNVIFVIPLNFFYDDGCCDTFNVIFVIQLNFFLCCVYALSNQVYIYLVYEKSICVPVHSVCVLKSIFK